MNGKKLIGVILLFTCAVVFTVIYTERFPKYGNTYTDVANIATQRGAVEQFISGTDVKIVDIQDIDDYRIAVVEPVNDDDARFGYLYFKRNSSGKYEKRTDVIWAPDDKIQVFRLTTEKSDYDIIMYNNRSVVLAQRTNATGFTENMSAASSGSIVSWKTAVYGYTYRVITAAGEHLSQ